MILTEIIILVVIEWRWHSWPHSYVFYSCNNNITPEDGRNTGRNMLVRTLWIKCNINI